MANLPFNVFAKLLPDATDPTNLLDGELGIDSVTNNLRYKDYTGTVYTLNLSTTLLDLYNPNIVSILQDVALSNIGLGKNPTSPTTVIDYTSKLTGGLFADISITGTASHTNLGIIVRDNSGNVTDVVPLPTMGIGDVYSLESGILTQASGTKIKYDSVLPMYNTGYTMEIAKISLFKGSTLTNTSATLTTTTNILSTLYTKEIYERYSSYTTSSTGISTDKKSVTLLKTNTLYEIVVKTDESIGTLPQVVYQIVYSVQPFLQYIQSLIKKVSSSVDKELNNSQQSVPNSLVQRDSNGNMIISDTLYFKDNVTRINYNSTSGYVEMNKTTSPTSPDGKLMLNTLYSNNYIVNNVSSDGIDIMTDAYASTWYSGVGYTKAGTLLGRFGMGGATNASASYFYVGGLNAYTSSSSDSWFYVDNSKLLSRGKRIWTEWNMGSGSGLDSDTVDGLHATSFIRSDANTATTNNAQITMNTTTNTVPLILQGASAGWASGLQLNNTTATTGHNWGIYSDNFGSFNIGDSTASIVRLLIDKNGVLWAGPGTNKIWHQGNQGSGSGMDSDTVDGLHASAFPLKTNAIGGTINVYEQVAFYENNNPNQTGTLKITMPKGWSSTMLTTVIKGYDYSVNGAYELILSGYNYITTSTWSYPTVTTSGPCPFTSVRFAYDGTYCCILLGVTNTSWQYPKIYIDKVIAGYSNSTGWGTGWSFSLLTAETGITNIATPVMNAGVNVDTVDGLHGTQFIRNDLATAQTMTGTLTSPGITLTGDIINDGTQRNFRSNNGNGWGFYVSNTTFGAYDWVNSKTAFNYAPSTHSFGILTPASATTNSIITPNNTLDDGSGNSAFKTISLTASSGLTLSTSGLGNVGLDRYANIIVGTPSGISTGNSWNVSDKNAVALLTILIDGTKVVKTSNNILDDGSGNSTFRTITSNVATGTSPLTVTSNTVVTNLNADMVDGYHIAFTATPNTVSTRDASGNLTVNALVSTVATGTAPLNVTSTTMVTNLNVQYINGLQSSQLLRNDVTTTQTMVASSFVVGGGLPNPTSFRTISVSDFYNTKGIPNFVGAWASSNYWGIGPYSGSTDNSVRIGTVTNCSGSDWMTQPSNMKLYIGNNRALTTADEGSGNALDADTIDTMHANDLIGSQVYQTNASSDQYYFIGTLPISSSTTYEKLFINLSGGSWTSTDLNDDWVMLANRGGFAYKYTRTGSGSRTTLRLIAYQQGDTSVQVYLKGVGGNSISGLVSSYATGLGNAVSALKLGAASTTVPSGTIIFDSGNSATYPPNAYGSGSLLDSDTVDGYHAGNTTGNVPVSNGTVNTNLNADMTDGYHAGNATGQLPVSNGTWCNTLNADMVDGLHSSAFLQVLKGNMNSSSDFNTTLTEGEYSVSSSSSIANAPYSGVIYGKLRVYVNDGGTHDNSTNWIWQYFDDTKANSYVRYKVNNAAWNSWVPIWNGNNMGSGTGMNSDMTDGYHAGNATGQLPISNGTVNTNLNADMVDGKHAGNGASNVLVLDGNGLVPTSNLPTSFSVSSSTTQTFQLDANNSGVRIKNNAGVLEVRNSTDTGYADVTVNNLNILGSFNEVSKTQINIADNTVYLNSNLSSSTAPSINAGVQINRGNQTASSLLWNESTQKWSAGLLGSEQSIVLTNDGRLTNLSGTGTLAWSNLTSVPISFTPSAHKSTHATGGSDVIVPSDIGAVNKSGDVMTGSLSLPDLGSNSSPSLIIAGPNAGGGTSATERYIEFRYASAGTTRIGAYRGGAYDNHFKVQTTVALSNDFTDILVAGPDTFLYKGNRVLTVADEGSGNNLNADTVDGLHASAFPLKINNVTGSVYVYEQVASYDYDSGTVTGTLKITMPKSWYNAMLTMVIKGYDYSSNGAYELIVSGYNFASTPGWYNTTATSSGPTPFTSVRFAYDGTYCCLLLGVTTTVWSFPKIYIDKVIASHSGTGWGSGWSLSMLTTETGITNIVSASINAGVNVDTVDGLHGTQFIRNDLATAQTMAGTLTSPGITLAGDIVSDGNERHFRASATNVNWGYYVNNGGFGAYDWQNSKYVFNYSPTYKSFSIGNISASSTIGSIITPNTTLDDGSGNSTFRTITSNVASGTAPLSITSNTVVTNLNADMVDGLHVCITGTGQSWGYIPKVGTDGVMEVGKYIDFHETSNDGIDYVNRFTSNGAGSILLNGNTIVTANNTGNSSGLIPISNGTLNTNLNADMVDGTNASSFVRNDLTTTQTLSGTLMVGGGVANPTTYRPISMIDWYTTKGAPSFIGAWANNGYWGIGPYSGSSIDNAVQIGYVAIPNANAWLTPPSNMKLYIGNNRALTTADEGSGNALDADTVDTLHATSFVRSDANTSITNNVQITMNATTATTPLILQGATTGLGSGISFNNTTASTGKNFTVFSGDGGYFGISDMTSAQRRFTIDTNGVLYAGVANKIWHQANQGSGSGMDSDTVDGLHAAAFLLSTTNSTQTVSGADIRVESTSSTERFSLQYNYTEGSLDFIYYTS